MKAAELAHKLVSQGREATRLDPSTVAVAVRVPQVRFFIETVALQRESGWDATGEYDARTGACRVVLRQSVTTEPPGADILSETACAIRASG
jgi:hypothetical protein